MDTDKAQALKLKEVRGAIITLIDHDAPAGQIGLKVNDVVLQLNGQNVEGAEQLRRMLKEIPPGRKVSIEISRDGNIQTLAVELADRQVLGHDVWNKIDRRRRCVYASRRAWASWPAAAMCRRGGGFHLPFFGSSLNVGALVEPLTSQMAEYLGVPNGLMVKQVARKSEAAVAGLKAFDVILKVGSEPVTNLAGWDRALRSNQGKPVQVTILRDKKQQTLTLQVDSKHRQGSLGRGQADASPKRGSQESRPDQDRARAVNNCVWGDAFCAIVAEDPQQPSLAPTSRLAIKHVANRLPPGLVHLARRPCGHRVNAAGSARIRLPPARCTPGSGSQSRACPASTRTLQNRPHMF